MSNRILLQIVSGDLRKVTYYHGIPTTSLDSYDLKSKVRILTDTYHSQMMTDGVGLELSTSFPYNLTRIALGETSGHSATCCQPVAGVGGRA